MSASGMIVDSVLGLCKRRADKFGYFTPDFETWAEQTGRTQGAIRSAVTRLINGDAVEHIGDAIYRLTGRRHRPGRDKPDVNSPAPRNSPNRAFSGSTEVDFGAVRILAKRGLKLTAIAATLRQPYSVIASAMEQQGLLHKATVSRIAT